MPNAILDVLPPRYAQALRALRWDIVQELRLRAGQPMLLKAVTGFTTLPQLLPQIAAAASAVVTAAEVEAVLAAATRQSAYSAQETLRDGYVTLPGGHRIGICGTCVQRSGETYGMKDITSLNIRVAHDVSIEPMRLRSRLDDNLLIIGCPGSGKTTLLRNCIRALSERGQCVCVADERGEIAAFDLGQNVDVLRGCGKQAAIERLLRTMAPDWIAVDEISAEEDVRALEKCSYCGVRLLATAHAANTDELHQRRLYRELLATGVFRRALVLRPDQTFSEERLGYG